MEPISLPNASFEGNNSVYLFSDGPETVLVDAGDNTDASRRGLSDALAERGLGFADVDRIFLTHWHGDHVGLAGEIQAASGAEVYVHADDAPLVAGDEDAWADLFALQERYFEEWGVPDDELAVILDRRMDRGALGEPPDVVPFEDGARFAVNGHELAAVHAPGHAKGLCVFEVELDGRRDAFTGDALLPVYTPNVGGADPRVDRPLARYLRTLRAIIGADYDRAWPGHRRPIDDPRGRAEFIVRHHESRAWRVLEALRRLGPCDTWTVSAALFGELDGIHILHGPGESFAHLEHLVDEGSVVREGQAYRLADGVAGTLDDVDGERWPLAS